MESLLKSTKDMVIEHLEIFGPAQFGPGFLPELTDRAFLAQAIDSLIDTGVLLSNDGVLSLRQKKPKQRTSSADALKILWGLALQPGVEPWRVQRARALYKSVLALGDCECLATQDPGVFEALTVFVSDQVQSCPKIVQIFES